MKKLIWANFKMNISTKKELKTYFDNSKKGSDKVDVVFFPQSIFLSDLVDSYSDFSFGIQNLWYEESGAFTWDNSVLAVKDLGLKYTIVGHWERKWLFGETDQLVNKKMLLCIKHDIRPILCIWENKEQRENWQALEIIQKQFVEACKWIEDLTKIDIAYEPIWAIGTWLIPNNEQIKEVHNFIRKLLSNNESRIIYGGSSNDTNSKELSQIENVNGFLVWGASLDTNKFGKMIWDLK